MDNGIDRAEALAAGVYRTERLVWLCDVRLEIYCFTALFADLSYKLLNFAVCWAATDQYQPRLALR